MTLTTDHRLVSRILIEQAQLEFDSGDLIQASGKGLGRDRSDNQGRWQSGAAGGTTDTMTTFRFIGRLEDETGREELRTDFHTAQALHSNFYEGWMTENQVRKSINEVRRLVAELDAMITEED